MKTMLTLIRQLVLLTLMTLIGFRTARAEDASCGYAYIGDITCGTVNQVTSVDITLWPPSDTTYEVTMVWGDVYDSSQRLESFVNYFTNITETKTVTLKAMFSEPDTQNLSITVRGYNSNYLGSDDTYYNSFSSEACYETVKPVKGDTSIWAVEVSTYDCKEIWLQAASVSSYGLNVSSSTSLRFIATKFCVVTGVVLLACGCLYYIIIRRRKITEIPQIPLAGDSLLQKTISTRRSTRSFIRKGEFTATGQVVV
jgi:hypothetical protein